MTQHTFKAEPDSLELVSTYIFDASREKVYAAYTNPGLISKWWGPEGDETIVKTMDVKPGGSWHFTITTGGQTISFRGVYHTVAAPERLVFTWQYEGAPTVAMETVVFEELADGKTKVTDQWVFQSVKERDFMATEKESMAGMMERLAKLF